MPDCVLEEFEPIRFEGEEGARDFFQLIGRSRPVKEICTIIEAARVVEEGEETDHCLVGAGLLAELEARVLYPPPVVGAVDGVGAEGED